MRLNRRVFLGQAVGGVAAAALSSGAATARAETFRPYWVQTHTETQLWSGPDASAISFGSVAQWSYFQVVAPQRRPRLHVWDPYRRNYAYVDAAAVGPVDPPSAEALSTPPTFWVATHRPAPLWSGPDRSAFPLGEVEPWSAFEVLATTGPRFRVRDPRSGGRAHLDPAAVGRIEQPDRPAAPVAWWWGTVAAVGANVRAAPTTEARILGEVERQTLVSVQEWVSGQEVLQDQPTWARLADDVYVYAPLLQASPVELPLPPPPHAPLRDRWIDVNLALQVAVAYEDAAPVYLARFSSGRPGWQTSTGVFPIFRRVANEVMDSSTLLGRDATRADYRVEDIKWTQYFTADGQAIHHNYWRDPALFGIPSSHGCLGMLESDARWFWDWATIGTPLVIHA